MLYASGLCSEACYCSIAEQSRVMSGSQPPKGQCVPHCQCCCSNLMSSFPVDEIVSTLGEGAFGKVVECLDHSKYV